MVVATGAIYRSKRFATNQHQDNRDQPSLVYTMFRDDQIDCERLLAI